MGDQRVWTVERGEYSDHRVMCVCATKAQAEAVAAAYNGGDVDTYERAFIGSLPVVDEPRSVTVYGMTVTLWDDGTTDAVNEFVNTHWEFDLSFPQHAQPATWRWVRAPMHWDAGGRLEVYGTDLERVRRVFSDRKARLRAEDAFRMAGERHG